jgi:hypothetical protein
MNNTKHESKSSGKKLAGNYIRKLAGEFIHQILLLIAGAILTPIFMMFLNNYLIHAIIIMALIFIISLIWKVFRKDPTEYRGLDL